MAGRVGGQLAITRSIGDHSLKKMGVIPIPTIKKYTLSISDKWIIMATDGIWDCLKDNDVEMYAKLGDESSEILTHKIVDASLAKGSKDNITCLVIKL